jgi:hypothetical protein
MNTEIALALMLVEVEAENFLKRFQHYVNQDDADLPDCSGLEQSLKALKEARRKHNNNQRKK